MSDTGLIVVLLLQGCFRCDLFWRPWSQLHKHYDNRPRLDLAMHCRNQHYLVIRQRFIPNPPF